MDQALKIYINGTSEGGYEPKIKVYGREGKVEVRKSQQIDNKKKLVVG